MLPFPRKLRPLLLALLLAVPCLHTRGDRTAPARPTAILSSTPHIVLWAWEEPEDLRTADARNLGVAFLAERVFIGRQITVLPRRQRILLPQGIWTAAVVRLETAADFQDSPATRRATANAVLQASRLPNLRALQVDFDATQSQRVFYNAVLQQVRAALPPGLPLEITALVSWCSQSQGWLQTLPVDAAVPMDFRLGRHIGDWPSRNPLCSDALGVSTDEPHPAEIPSGQTIYVFAPRPFTTAQLALLNQGKIPVDTKGPR